ncbi:hypothetical protein UR09_03040 [Candidatus Nitromaritima sp. SCGC AAA799-A02]|nr:hypothetical protein UZ36_06655 [Candidatus Nitromaritima sp. SCGC AAA799-C22]KMP11528.1 hypothetical protein UR09_03040 [Candidatus Nitromaritima sp. SCGC AAA799-A02]
MMSPENLKILLVDDTPMNLSLVSKLLGRRGHTVETAENGLEAFEVWKNNNTFDVILMDVHMPVMDGLEATVKIREYESEWNKNHPDNPKPRIPIIASTANNDRTDAESYTKAGMDGLITKPIDIKTIIEDIRKIIEQCQNKP